MKARINYSAQRKIYEDAPDFNTLTDAERALSLDISSYPEYTNRFYKAKEINEYMTDAEKQRATLIDCLCQGKVPVALPD